ncbi:unnamed protein product [Orchesella dallaii]|uniref:DOMON domain-containing protein n=1 Tax=Orchesella dallaii TaxID=48710 RepID=A0ABP1RPS0_9HEXA
MYLVRIAINVVLCSTLATSRILILEEGYFVGLDISKVGNDSIISLALNVNTLGYVGFGFGLSEDLARTDAFFGGFNSITNAAYIDDYYIGEDKVLKKDGCAGCQNWDLAVVQEIDRMEEQTEVNLFTVDDPPLLTSPGPATTSRATTPIGPNTPTNSTTTIGPTTTTGPVTRHLHLDDNYEVEVEIGRSGFDAYITL